MSKVEEVAAAVREANDGEGENYLYSQFYTVEERSICLARAAIEAMREPTPEMLAAMSKGIARDDLPSTAYAAAIDAALEETR